MFVLAGRSDGQTCAMISLVDTVRPIIRRYFSRRNFHGRQIHFPALDPDLGPDDVQLDGAVPEDRAVAGLAAALRCLNHRMQAYQQDGRQIRLGDELVAAGLEHPDLGFLIGAQREHKNRVVAAAQPADLPDQFETFHTGRRAGQVQIENPGVIVVDAREIERLGDAARLIHGVAMILEECRGSLPLKILVLDQQDLHAPVQPSLRRLPRTAALPVRESRPFSSYRARRRRR